MPDPAMRARVVRLINGDVRPDDIARLFLFARDRCDGREVVQEIGDFVAHHAERTKGIVTRATREWFASARFSAATHADGGVDMQNLPSVTPELLLANAYRVELRSFRKLRLNRTDAVRATKEIVPKLSRKMDGRYWIAPLAMTESELDLVEILLRHIVAMPAFTGRRLFDDFLATLKSNGLISKSEVDAAPFLSDVVQLFAIASIHACDVIMPDDTTIRLYASPGETLSISAAVPVARNVSFASMIFTTELDTQQHTAESLLDRAAWDGSIELGTDRRLHLLG